MANRVLKGKSFQVRALLKRHIHWQIHGEQPLCEHSHELCPGSGISSLCHCKKQVCIALGLKTGDRRE